jgi:hypothetical protein
MSQTGVAAFDSTIQTQERSTAMLAEFSIYPLHTPHMSENVQS